MFGLFGLLKGEGARSEGKQELLLCSPRDRASMLKVIGVSLFVCVCMCVYVCVCVCARVCVCVLSPDAMGLGCFFKTLCYLAPASW